MKPIKWVVEDSKEKEIWWPSEEFKRRARVNDPSIYEKAASDPVAFWEKQAKEDLEWFKPWDKTYEENLPYFKWFVGGKINASYNAADRHVKAGKGNKPAIIWVPEPPNEPAKIITYQNLKDEVSRFANVLKKLGVKKGDRVGIYLPMIPEVQIAILACTRIGAVHSVVFSAFTGDALRVRLEDSEAKVLITSDGYYRRGKVVNLKNTADEGINGTKVEKVVVVKRAGNEVNMLSGRDFWLHELMRDASPNCEAEAMDSETMMFLLYTSGTTGKPKGVMHTTGGYLLQAYLTTRWVFDLQEDDILWCTADIGWITGHTYLCYGPLLNGTTLLLYEGAPDYPGPDRWWEIIEKYKVTKFYTAPTAIRVFVRAGEEWPKKHDMSTLRLLGTVGEPIDREAWLWYFNVIGGGRCPIVDTWWQTETGGTLMMSLPGIGPFIPTVSGRAFPGSQNKIVDEEGNPSTSGGYLVLVPPLTPGMMRGLYKADEKYRESYWSRYPNRYYFTGDGARDVSSELPEHIREKGKIKSFIRVTGRVDDVMKVAGHRMSTAELEDGFNRHPDVTETAVVPQPDPLKGEVPVAYIVLKNNNKASDALAKELVDHIAKVVGPIAKPKQIFFVDELPKTRSGKIMRRILKALVTKDKIGDTSTLVNPGVVEDLMVKTGYNK